MLMEQMIRMSARAELADFACISHCSDSAACRRKRFGKESMECSPE